jgi:hypothetical protein
MSDKASKKLAKKMAKKAKKNDPNKKLKKHMIWLVLILLPFLLSRPVAMMTASSSIGSVSSYGASVNEDNNITAQFVGATSYKNASLVEINILVDLPPEAVNYALNPQVYDTKKNLMKNVTVEKINAYYYAIFISQVDLANFPCYVFLPQPSLENSSISLGDTSQGFIISPSNMTQKEEFHAQNASQYAQKSQQLLTEKYNDQLKEIDNKIKDFNSQIAKLNAENQQLIANASGLTRDEKQQVADQIQANNSTIASTQNSISDLEKSKLPLTEKIKALETLGN